MQLITSNMLQRMVIEQKRKFEGLLPGIVKKLIQKSCPEVHYIRVPDNDDIWASGFDGIVESEQRTQYVAAGTSVWEFGTVSKPLKKIDEDLKKRTANSLGIDKANATLYLVIPSIWSYRKSIEEWTKENREDWKAVYVYDASVLCDWLNSELSVCIWLLEECYDKKSLGFSTVKQAWEEFSSQTTPAFAVDMFVNGRDRQKEKLIDESREKIIRVKGQSRTDAYGFCLASLIKSQKAESVIVVKNEKTYHFLTDHFTKQVYLLLFPFENQVSNNSITIVCYNQEDTSVEGSIELPPLRKSEFIAGLYAMHFSQSEAEELYYFTHGNFLALIRRIPGTSALGKPLWASSPNIRLLQPLVFLRHINCDNLEDRKFIEALSGESFDCISEMYCEFLRMEDAPIKRVNSEFLIVNREEAFQTLQINIVGSAAKKLFKLILESLKSIAETGPNYYLQTKISELLKNYVYFYNTGSDTSKINEQIGQILKYTDRENSRDVVFDNLSALSLAAPTIIMRFINCEYATRSLTKGLCDESTFEKHMVSVLDALEELCKNEEMCVDSYRLLRKLCDIEHDFGNRPSPRRSLLNVLCLWNVYSGINLESKIKILKGNISDDPKFGVPFCIDLLSESSFYVTNKFGTEGRLIENITCVQLQAAVDEVGRVAFEYAIKEKCCDWIQSLLLNYQLFSNDLLYYAADMLKTASFSTEELVKLHYYARRLANHIRNCSILNNAEYVSLLDYWINMTQVCDPILQHAWMFFEYYEFPLQKSDIDRIGYLGEDKGPESIRKYMYSQIKEKFGVEGFCKLLYFMNDAPQWGQFIAENCTDGEFIELAKTVYHQQKYYLLGGLLNCGSLLPATRVFLALSDDLQIRILSMIDRNDIDKWLTTSEKQYAFWQTKQMRTYDEKRYQALLAFHPFGLIGFLYDHVNQFKSMKSVYYEVLSKIIESETKNRNEFMLLDEVIHKIDKQKYYSDEWAKLCFALINKEKITYYPQVVRIYLFRNPCELYKLITTDNPLIFTRHRLNYSLPQEAYKEYECFKEWASYFYSKTKGSHDNRTRYEAFWFLESVFGKSKNGQDGFFPHEFIRNYLEECQDQDLNIGVAREKHNTYGSHKMNEGIVESEISQKYKAQADQLKWEYPNTAEVLRTLADYFDHMAQKEAEYAELQSFY